MAESRLQKIIAEAGICSRRKAEELITKNKVYINGRLANLGDKADPNIDRIEVNGVSLKQCNNESVILLNKPAGIISSCYDQFGRITVLDLIPSNLRKGMYPVGRLDYNTRGAILITNNGNLTLKLTHPRYQHKKTYKVILNGIVSKKDLKEWQKGIIIDGLRTMPAKINLVSIKERKSFIEIELSEGRNRQIRKSAQYFGYKVIDLQRTSIGNIKLNSLPEGSWQYVDKEKWYPLLTNNNL